MIFCRDALNDRLCAIAQELATLDNRPVPDRAGILRLMQEERDLTEILWRGYL